MPSTSVLNVLRQHNGAPGEGLEPSTNGLTVRCAADCATPEGDQLTIVANLALTEGWTGHLRCVA